MYAGNFVRNWLGIEVKESVPALMNSTIYWRKRYVNRLLEPNRASR